VSDDDADDDDADHDDVDHDAADHDAANKVSDHDTSDHDTSDHDTSDSEDTQEKVYVSDQDTEIHSIEAEISAGEIHIKASDDEQIQVETKGISKALGLQCKKKGNTLQILSTGTLHKILGNNGTITIYVPKDLLLQEVSLEVGAGNIYIEEMQAKNLEIECGAGNVEYYVTGSQSDYNYEIECGMGNINIDDGKYSGLGQEYDVDNHADRDISIECGMGNVSLYYE
jgi:DUF4097 and DUF4098 domain-containing protein YvlB